MIPITLDNMVFVGLNNHYPLLAGGKATVRNPSISMECRRPRIMEMKSSSLGSVE